MGYFGKNSRRLVEWLFQKKQKDAAGISPPLNEEEMEYEMAEQEALPEGLVTEEEYQVVNGVMTVGVLTLKNGATVVGVSNAVKPAAFNEEASAAEAREDAVAQILVLEDYLAKQKEYEGSTGGGTGTTPPDGTATGSFGRAVDLLYAGKRVSRPGSTEPIAEVTVKLSEEKTLKGYLASPEDVLATDWTEEVALP